MGSGLEEGLADFGGPGHIGRPRAASPGHLDRVALGVPIEHRTLGG